MLVFLRETGTMVEMLVLLPLNTLTLLSAVMFSAETAVVTGARIEPIPSSDEEPPLDPPAKAG
jgi:hypothetical protein